MTGNIAHLDNSNFDKEIKDKHVAIIDFWAAWCGPCQMFGKVLEEFSSENPSVYCAKVNVDEAQDLASRFGVMSIPTILFFKEGKLVKTQVGMLPKSMLKQIIDTL
ncbi:MAG: thioredoxin [archaeon]